VLSDDLSTEQDAGQWLAVIPVGDALGGRRGHIAAGSATPMAKRADHDDRSSPWPASDSCSYDGAAQSRGGDMRHYEVTLILDPSLEDNDAETPTFSTPAGGGVDM